MLQLSARLFLFLLLVADYVGDPYFGNSPLSRPFSSQDAFCHSFVQRDTLLKATTPIQRDFLIAHAPTESLAAYGPAPLMRSIEIDHVFLEAADPIYALKSLRC
jgi:hypothetical protein